MVAEFADRQVRDAVQSGRQVRLRALKPSSDVRTFQSEVAGMGGTDEDSMTGAEMREAFFNAEPRGGSTITRPLAVR